MFTTIYEASATSFLLSHGYIEYILALAGIVIFFKFLFYKNSKLSGARGGFLFAAIVLLLPVTITHLRHANAWYALGSYSQRNFETHLGCAQNVVVTDSTEGGHFVRTASFSVENQTFQFDSAYGNFGYTVSEDEAFPVRNNTIVRVKTTLGHVMKLEVSNTACG